MRLFFEFVNSDFLNRSERFLLHEKPFQVAMGIAGTLSDDELSLISLEEIVAFANRF